MTDQGGDLHGARILARMRAIMRIIGSSVAEPSATDGADQRHEVGSREAVPDIGIAGPTIAAEWHDVGKATAPGIPIGGTRCAGSALSAHADRHAMSGDIAPRKTLRELAWP